MFCEAESCPSWGKNASLHIESNAVIKKKIIHVRTMNTLVQSKLKFYHLEPE